MIKTDKLLERILSDCGRAKTYNVIFNNHHAVINIKVSRALDIEYKIDLKLFEKISDKLIKKEQTQCHLETTTVPAN